VTALLALLLLTDSRRATRLDSGGRLVVLADQDRSRWDRSAIDEGCRLSDAALEAPSPVRFALEAAIAAEHGRAASWELTDWRRIVQLYDALLEQSPSPVVALNRAVAVGFAAGPVDGLAELDKLGAEPRLAGYAYLPAARADALRRLGRAAQARLAYEEALLLTDNDVERDYLSERLTGLANS
jgi:predicted RNA polymerase sigma factor